MISETTVNHVRELPIEDVIGRYVDLKKAGANYRASCPFHNENTPSFYVVPAKNFFKCQGCGAGGDALEFVMRKENLPFYEAVKSIAQQHSIGIEESEVQGKTPEQKADETIMREWLMKANQVYQQRLTQTL